MLTPALRRSLVLFLPFFILALASCASSPPREADSAGGEEPAPGASADIPATSDQATTATIFSLTPDPIEPVNRVSFEVTDEGMRWIVVPLSRGYRVILPEPARRSVSKFGANLAYPVRLINTLLQGKFIGARDETGRFVINTTVGILGLFDPAKRWGIEPWKEDFGQTFGKWGMDDGFYFFIPALGPSSGRDAVGRIGDSLANPATYIPGLSLFLNFNDLTFRVDDYQRLTNSQSDPYVLLREVWTVTREKDVLDYAIPPNAYEMAWSATAGAIFLTGGDPKFRHKAKTHKVRIAATGKEMPYSIWPREGSDCIVFILPGVGGHRDSGMAHAAAEMVYNAGYTPVSISSPFNWEFFGTASTADVPGFTPRDAADVDRALAAVYADVQQREKGRYPRAAVVGLSLGGLHALFIGADAAAIPEGESGQMDGLPRPPYSRFVAISPPVDPLYALSQLDQYYLEPLNWPEADRAQRIREALYKTAIVAEEGLDADPRLPFDESETKFLIGLGYRNILQNTIFETQRRHSLGVLQTPYRWSSRSELYEEILRFSFMDYIDRFVLPSTLAVPGESRSRDELAAASGMRSLEARLKGNERLRVVVSLNDFILRPDDGPWLQSVFGTRLVQFPDGGHLGNLQSPEARKALTWLLEGPSLSELFKSKKPAAGPQ